MNIKKIRSFALGWAVLALASLSSCTLFVKESFDVYEGENAPSDNSENLKVGPLNDVDSVTSQAVIMERMKFYDIKVDPKAIVVQSHSMGSLRQSPEDSSQPSSVHTLASSHASSSGITRQSPSVASHTPTRHPTLSEEQSMGSFVHPTAPNSIIHNVAIDGDLAYISWYTTGLQVLDISSPAIAHPQ